PRPCYTRFPYTTLFRSIRRLIPLILCGFSIALLGACLGDGDGGGSSCDPSGVFLDFPFEYSIETDGTGASSLLAHTDGGPVRVRSEEHTSELQSRENLV